MPAFTAGKPASGAEITGVRFLTNLYVFRVLVFDFWDLVFGSCFFDFGKSQFKTTQNPEPGT